jgi:predicted CoA-binding protein
MAVSDIKRKNLVDRWTEVKAVAIVARSTNPSKPVYFSKSGCK